MDNKGHLIAGFGTSSSRHDYRLILGIRKTTLQEPCDCAIPSLKLSETAVEFVCAPFENKKLGQVLLVFGNNHMFLILNDTNIRFVKLCKILNGEHIFQYMLRKYHDGCCQSILMRFNMQFGLF